MQKTGLEQVLQLEEFYPRSWLRPLASGCAIVTERAQRLLAQALNSDVPTVVGTVGTPQTPPGSDQKSFKLRCRELTHKTPSSVDRPEIDDLIPIIECRT